MKRSAKTITILIFVTFLFFPLHAIADAARVKKEAKAVLSELKTLLGKGRSLDAVRGTNACIPKMHSYLREAEALEARANKIDSVEDYVFDIKGAASTMLICVKCTGTAPNNCDTVAGYLRDAERKI
ncbi:MAG: hypothetical protein KDD66_02655 [Bdellovibrionales bacterium]|nr:hypothetical protein [Bdellovibrionales bacterium]